VSRRTESLTVGQMRYFALLTATILAGCTSNQYATEQHDRELAGRGTGASQRCIPAQPHQNFRVADNDGHILLYGNGRTVWVTHLEGFCGFSQDDQLISDAWDSQYCSGQVVRSFDISRAEGPSCVIGRFTPYTQS